MATQVFASIYQIIIMITALLFSFQNNDVNYELKQPIAEVESIGIYVDSFKFGGHNVLTSSDPNAFVPIEEHKIFIDALKQLPFERIAVSYEHGSLGTYAVKICYRNGAYEIISNEGFQIYSIDGKNDEVYTHYICEREAWVEFIWPYITNKG